MEVNLYSFIRVTKAFFPLLKVSYKWNESEDKLLFG